MIGKILKIVVVTIILLFLAQFLHCYTKIKVPEKAVETDSIVSRVSTVEIEHITKSSFSTHKFIKDGTYLLSMDSYQVDPPKNRIIKLSKGTQYLRMRKTKEYADASQEINIEDLVQIKTSNFSIDSQKRVVSFEVHLINVSEFNIKSPLRATIANLRPISAGITVQNSHGGGNSDGAFWDYDSLIGDDNILSQGESSAPLNWKFNSPEMRLFSFQIKLTGYVILPDSITVPDVVGLPEMNAFNTLRSSGLRIGDLNYVHNDTIPANLIISQFPPADSTVFRGTKIGLMISSGTKAIVMPDLCGLTQVTAVEELNRLGLFMNAINWQYDYSYNIDRDYIISQNPPPGSNIDEYSSIVLTLSLGPEPIPVPNVMSLQKNNAINLIETCGFSIGRIIYIRYYETEKDYVITQIPKSDSLLIPNATVDLVVSEGPANNTSHKTWFVDSEPNELPLADFSDIQDAVNHASAGDTIFVFQNTYAGGIIVDKQLYIDGIGYPIIDSFNLGSGFTLRCDSTFISGFHCINAGARHFSVTLPTDNPAEIEMGTENYYARHNRVINNEFASEHGGNGIYIGSRAYYNVVENNIFEKKYIDIEDGDYNTITNNQFIGTIAHDYIHVEGSSKYSFATGSKILNNQISNHDHISYPISINNYAEETEVIGNEIVNCFNGIRINGHNSKVKNNSISGRDNFYMRPTGISLYNVNDTDLENNHVTRFKFGIVIYSYAYEMGFGHTRMRNNTFENNIFGFSIQFGDHSPLPIEFDHDIDTSNTIDGKKLYYLTNLSDTTLTPTVLPDAGFIACLNCQNITLAGFSMHGNSHGLLLYKVTHSKVKDIVAYQNLNAGLGLFECQDIQIENSIFTNTGDIIFRKGVNNPNLDEAHGIYINGSSLIQVNNCRMETNWHSGVMLVSSEHCVIAHSEMVDNGVGIKEGIATFSSGIRLYRSDLNTFHTNKIFSLTPNEQKYGVYIELGNDNLVYNNYLQNEINAYDKYDKNIWNIEKTEGENIVGGPYIGGNYWVNYSGNDADGDYIIDVISPYNCDGQIKNGGDFLPLLNYDSLKTVSKVSIISPQEKEYQSRSIQLYYQSLVEIESDSFRLDEGEFIPMEDDTMDLSRLTLGDHLIQLKVGSSSSETHMAEVPFCVAPLALTDSTLGYPDFPDEVAFSFKAMPVDYTLSFETINPDDSIKVYLNKCLRGTIGSSPTLSDYIGEAFLLTSIPPSSVWQSHTISIAGDILIADIQSIIAFINMTNANAQYPTHSWAVRHVTLHADMVPSLPMIGVKCERVYVTGEELFARIELSHIHQDSSLVVFVYLEDPAGKKMYYPLWQDKAVTVPDYYVLNNHNGRLPVPFKFEPDSVSGMFRLVGEIWKTGLDSSLVSYSSQTFFCGHSSAVQLYCNRDILNAGDEFILNCAVSDTLDRNVSLVISIEGPSGEMFYLPDRTAHLQSYDWTGLRADYVEVGTYPIDDRWESGTYRIKADLFNEEGEMLVFDMLEFNVCEGDGLIHGQYLLPGIGNVTALESRLTLYNVNEAEFLEEQVIKGSHTGYRLVVSPGTYTLSGECVVPGDLNYIIPASIIVVGCGQEIVNNVTLERTIDSDYVSPFRQELTERYDVANNIFSPLPRNEDDCSNRKIMIYLDINDGALEMILADYTDEFETVDEVKSFLGNSIRNSMKDRYKDVEFLESYSLWERVYTIRELEDQKVRKIAAEELLRAVKGTEHIYYIGIYGYGHDYHVVSHFTDLETLAIVKDTNVFKMYADVDFYTLLDNIHYMQTENDEWLARIEENEAQCPLPPRDPKVTINLTNPRVSAANPETDININIVDCMGRPAYCERFINKVRFGIQTGVLKTQKRGTLETHPAFIEDHGDPGWRELEFGEGGNIQPITYKLTKGFDAGEEKIKIRVPERGYRDNVFKTIVIPIYGIGLSTFPQKSILDFCEKNVIDISLYEQNDSGKQIPIEGATITINESKSKLRGGIILNNSAPTDEFGMTIIEYKAGPREGLVKIQLEYQPPGFDEPLVKVINFQVKSKEYIANINWYECRQVHGWGVVESDFQSSSGAHTELNFEESFRYDAKVIWNEITGSEKVSANLSYDIVGKSWSGDVVGIFSSWAEETNDYDGYISSHVSYYNSKSKKILLPYFDQIEIDLAPIQIPTRVKGMIVNHKTSYRKDFFPGGSEESFDYWTVFHSINRPYSPNPYIRTGCINQADLGINGLCRRWSNTGFTNSPLLLKKNGKTSYQSYHFHSYENGSGRLYIHEPYGGLYLLPGSFYFSSQFCVHISESFYCLQTLGYHWYYYPHLVEERSFNVNIFKK